METNNEYYITFKKANCMSCYKCIRNCPVKSIGFSLHQAHIIADECILCGKCISICPQNAKEIRNDVDIVKKYIKEGKKVIASVAPSFITKYKGFNFTSFSIALKRLGFFDAFETANGAQYVSKAYEEILNNKTDDVIISSCCPTVNLLIQKHYPKAIPYLAKIISPMHAHTKLIKNDYPDAVVVFIGPCISKKEEAFDYELNADSVLTFTEIDSWLKSEKITLDRVEERIDNIARLYPISGGIIKTMVENSNYNYFAVDGIDNCIRVINDVINNNVKNCFIEMSACTGSCIGGLGINGKNEFSISNIIKIKNYAGNKPLSVDSSKISLTKNFSNKSCEMPLPSPSILEIILKKMGKILESDQLNCGSCGYDTCIEKAKALYYGKADLTMCLPYLKEKAESFSDNIISNTPTGIIVLNEDLEIELINPSACNIFKIRKASDVLKSPLVRILDPVLPLKVLNEKKSIIRKKEYLAEYDKYIEETITYDDTYKIIIIFMHDVTIGESDRIQKELISRKTIEVTDKIIEKQMRSVQEIASLLGESTAETKVALNKLKEFFKNE